MKKIASYMLVLALSAISMGLVSSCEYVDPLLDSTYYEARAIEGPWKNSGFEISEVAWGEYEVYDQRTNTYWYEYLDPFYYFEDCVPDGCWAEYYEPYYSTTKDELCWHVYCRGRFKEILIFQSGKYAPR